MQLTTTTQLVERKTLPNLFKTVHPYIDYTVYYYFDGQFLTRIIRNTDGHGKEYTSISCENTSEISDVNALDIIEIEKSEFAEARALAISFITGEIYPLESNNE